MHRLTSDNSAQPKTNLLKSRRPASAGYRAVRDSMLAAWYPSLYAPRTGGAYDSHHRTARIAGCVRQRGSGVAARGGRAAAGDEFLISLGRNDRAKLAQAFGRGLSEETITPNAKAHGANSPVTCAYAPRKPP